MFHCLLQASSLLSKVSAGLGRYAKHSGKRGQLSAGARVTVAMVFLASGCAPKAERIQAAYVSPLTYQSYDCSQLVAEMQRVDGRLLEVSQQQNDMASRDTVVTTIGIILFFPALLFLIGEDHSEEIARLKGEAESVEQAAVLGSCTDLLRRMEQERGERAEG